MLDKSPHPLASRNYAEHLFDMAAVIMLVLDTNGCIERINPKGCEILGYRVEDILGKDWFDHFIPDNHRQETRRVFHRLMNGEEESIRNYDNSVLTASGEIRHIEWHNTLLHDTHGHITSVLSSGLDVTEQRRNTAILQMYERVVKNVTDHIAVVDRDYIYRLVNQEYAQFYGRSREECEGHGVAELFGSEVFDSTIRHRLDRCFAGEVVAFDDGVDIPGGDRRYLDVIYTPDFDDDGRVGTAIVCARDITDLHLSRMRLQESEARYKALFHGNSDAVYLHGFLPSGECDRFEEVNEAACRCLGYTKEELLNLSPKDIDVGNLDKIRYAAVQSLMAEGHVVFEMEHVGKNARTLPVEVSARLIELQGRPMVMSIARDITERIQSQQAQEENQEYIQKLLNNMAEGVYGLDTGGFCTFVNQSFLNLLGYETAEELLGRHIHELIHHSHPDGSLYPHEQCRAYQAHIENCECRVDDEVFWRSDGSSFPVEYCSYPLRRNDEVIGSVVTFQNISERRETEEKLQDARQILQHVIDTVPNYVFWKDRDSRFLGCNEAFARLAGLQRPEEIIGKDDHALAWHNFAGLYQRDDAQVISSGKPRLNIIEPMEMKDGTTGWLETSKVPFLDTQGQIIGVLGVFQDITARVHAEDKLRLSAKVFESTMEGIVVTNPAGDIVSVNPAFTEITGYSEAEVLGKNPRLLKSGRHDKSFYQAMRASILQTGSWRGEIWNRHKSGEIYPEWLSINTLRDEAKNTIHYVAVFTDISQMKRSEAELEHLAHHDPLTGLPNRLLFNARLEYAIQRTHREVSSLALLYIDLDHFKTVNDSLGHPFGDKLLKSVAAKLGASVRGEDTVARVGGDEFVILLEEVKNPIDATNVAEKILNNLSKRYDLDGQSVFIGASIGISIYPADGHDGTTLLQNADAALYRSKEEGRNTFRFYSPELTQKAHNRLTLQTELRRAIERQEFVLHYQPQVDTASGVIVGAEALVRWQHPESGLILPLHFIPMAEETGLILPLGDWVLNTACEQLQAWLDSGLPPITMAVNLSPRQFQHRDLVNQLRTVLDATNLPPRLLELEITEGAIMEQGEAAVTTLRALKDLGLRLAIDDFGTGYSSLAYLRRFPIDTLKIDQSFMRDIPHDTCAMEIAATIIAMAHNLHLQVLAEGVETREQLDFLLRNGCDTCQGFLDSRPVTAEFFAVLLRTGLSSRGHKLRVVV